ncbi:hypothetical protein AX14_013431 [Amanita brunnescens Koide BX004]|nr:hypothetical protein AX14_013431 [Amanita brunnescens Koide BX004]
MIIITKESFWIKKSFRESIMDALEQFQSHGYVDILKSQITSTSLPPEQDLPRFLYNQIVHFEV